MPGAVSTHRRVGIGQIEKGLEGELVLYSVCRGRLSAQVRGWGVHLRNKTASSSPSKMGLFITAEDCSSGHGICGLSSRLVQPGKGRTFILWRKELGGVVSN